MLKLPNEIHSDMTIKKDESSTIIYEGLGNESRLTLLRDVD